MRLILHEDVGNKMFAVLLTVLEPVEKLELCLVYRDILKENRDFHHAYQIMLFCKVRRI